MQMLCEALLQNRNNFLFKRKWVMTTLAAILVKIKALNIHFERSTAPDQSATHKLLAAFVVLFFEFCK